MYEEGKEFWHYDQREVVNMPCYSQCTATGAAPQKILNSSAFIRSVKKYFGLYANYEEEGHNVTMRSQCFYKPPLSVLALAWHAPTISSILYLKTYHS
jgi:hypothetical protein